MPRKTQQALRVLTEGSEHQNQALVMQWASARQGAYPELALLHAIPNFAGRLGKATAMQGARLKREGRKPGVPDLCLPVPKGTYHGFYGELKVGKNGATPAQRQWMAALTAQGYYVVLRHGWEAMVLAIDTYVHLPPFQSPAVSPIAVDRYNVLRLSGQVSPTPRGGEAMSKYRKKPVVVEAIQFTRAMIEAHLFDKAPLPQGVRLVSADSHRFAVTTIHGEDAAIVAGDWIIAEPDGERFYPCKPDIFEATYEPV